ncbi:MAG: DUF5320 domain-containing protein, partial [Candidatus Latescibacteria bacterium]|nr:DUF5320 domain-containing protein [Candidatus Latescibacterota bacterium]
MPGFDGTGPKGQGPRTGWWRGKCVSSMSESIGRALAGIIIPVIGIVANDIRKPDGITRKFFSSLKSRLFHKHLKYPEVHLIYERKNR